MKHILILITAALGMVVIGLLTLPWIGADPIADEARTLSAETVESEEPAPDDDAAYFADFGETDAEGETADDSTAEDNAVEDGESEETGDEPVETSDEELMDENEAEVDSTETDADATETNADLQDPAEETETALSSEQEGVEEDAGVEEPMEETTLEEGEDAALPETASRMPLIGLLGLLCLGGVLALRAARR